MEKWKLGNWEIENFAAFILKIPMNKQHWCVFNLDNNKDKTRVFNYINESKCYNETMSIAKYLSEDNRFELVSFCVKLLMDCNVDIKNINAKDTNIIFLCFKQDETAFFSKTDSKRLSCRIYIKAKILLDKQNE